MLIRNACLSDLKSLLDVEEKCWDLDLRGDSESITALINSYNEGQYVCEVLGQVCGVLYTQKINSMDDLLCGSFATQKKLHDINGSIIQLLAIAVDTNVAISGAVALRDHALSVARADPTINCVVAMTRCSRFEPFEEKSPLSDSVYVAYQDHVHSLKDPTIYFHSLGGAKLQQIVRNYRPSDVANLGNAVLIRYDLQATAETAPQQQNTSNYNTPADKNNHNLAAAICAKMVAMTATHLRVPLSAPDLLTAPIMNTLDSLQLLELHNWIEQRVGHALSPVFLFSNPTPQAVDNFLSGVAAAALPRPVEGLGAHEPIAIVGVGCRLPGGIDSLEQLWAVMKSKACLTRKVPFERWDVDALDLQALLGDDPDKIAAVQHGCFLDNVDHFDHKYFGLTLAEAREMDPNQRLVLETVARALDDCGKTRAQLEGNATGVFVGMSNSDYHDVPGAGFKNSRSVYAATGGAMSVVAGRVSNLFGLHGPSISVDTACSSSLVALHLAAQSLRLSECREAVVVGVNLLLAPWVSVAYARAGMTSADGKCHTFDEAANGYCRGEGCGAIVLKRLSDAMADGDSIYAVVKGSAVLQDGKSASLTAPNGHAQEMLMRAALSDAGVAAEDVQYIEAHGTGTKLGDPIEMQAIAAVYCANRAASDPLLVSSVKANIGHLEAAAGMAGLFSALLALSHKVCPANANLNKLNAAVAHIIQGRSVVLPTEATELSGNEGRLVAAVSSFGYSGTIAHVVLEEAPTSTKKLEKSLGGKVVWQFAGQGTIKVGCGRELFVQESVFRDALALCDDVLRASVGVAATDLLYPEVSGRYSEAEAERLLLDTRYAQPVLVAFEFALAQLWRSKGAAPDIVLGHSLGEYAAAVVAEVLTIEDCLRLVSARAQLVHDSQACVGVMVATRATVAQVQQVIESTGVSDVSIAAVNGAQNVVVSGSETGVAAVVAGLGAEVRSLRLRVTHAFHSPLMNSIVQSFEQVLSTVQFHPATCRVVSTVLGREIAEGEMQDPSYWLRHLRDPVRYCDAVTAAQRSGAAVFVEMGGDQTLSRLAQAVVSCGDAAKVCSFSSGLDFNELSLARKDLFSVQYQPKSISYTVPHHRLLHSSRDVPVGDGSGLAQVLFHGKPRLESDALSWLVQDPQSFPCGAICCSIDAAVSAHFLKQGEGDGSIVCSDIVFGEAIETASSVISISCIVSGNEQYSVKIDDQIVLSCRVNSSVPLSAALPVKSLDPSAVSLSSSELQKVLQQSSASASVCAILTGVSHTSNACHCTLQIPTHLGAVLNGYVVHPVLLQSVLHACVVHQQLAHHRSLPPSPVGCDSITVNCEGRLRHTFGDSLTCIVKSKETDDKAYPSSNSVQYDCVLLSGGGEVVMALRDLQFSFSGVAGVSEKLLLSVPVCELFGEDLRDHVVHGHMVLPGAALMEIVLNAVLSDSPAAETAVQLSGFAVSSPVIIHESQLDGRGSDSVVACVMTRDGAVTLSNEEMVSARCQSFSTGDSVCFSNEEAVSISASDSQEFLPGEMLYAEYRRRGLVFGPSLQLIGRIQLHTEQMSVCIIDQRDLSLRPSQSLSFQLLDAMVHATGALSYLNRGDTSHSEELFVPFAVDTVRLHVSNARLITSGQEVDRLVISTKLINRSANSAIFNCSLHTAGGALVATMTGLHMVPIAAADVDNSLLRALRARNTVATSHWEACDELDRPSRSQSQLAGRILLCGGIFDPWSTEMINDAWLGIGAPHLTIESTNVGELLSADTTAVGDSDWVVLLCPPPSSDVGAESIQQLLLDIAAACHVTRKLMVVAAIEENQTFVSTRCSLAAVSGAVLSAQLEYPAVQMRSLQVVVASEEECVSSVLQAVVSEVNGAWRHESEVLYRGEERLVRRYSEAQKWKAVSSTVTSQSFVITGGLGGLGLLTAKLLARSGAKHIFLVSRSGHVAHEGQGLEADLLWLQIESGAAVHVLTCDVSEEAAVVRMLAQVREVAGSLDGVVHCAGVLRDALIRGGGAAAGCVDVWQAKATSAWWLHKHTLQDELKAFVCYSSITAAVGNGGQCAYGAANRFLDSLVGERRRLGLSGVSIRWPAVSGVGMAAATGNKVQDHLAEWSISVPDVEAVLHQQLISSEEVSSEVLVVAKGFVSALVPPISLQFEAFISQTAQPVSTVKDGAKSVVPSKFTTDQIDAATRLLVRDLVTDASQLSDDVSLLEGGLDSFGATELAHLLSREFGLKLFPTFVFDFPTVSHVVAQLCVLLGVGGEQSEATSALVVPPVLTSVQSDVAIVGLSCRLPGDVNDLSAMWAMLSEGKDMTSEVSLTRWDTDALMSALDNSQEAAVVDRIRFGGFLSDAVLESFNAPSFGISDFEAAQMDPAQRLVLDSCHEALLDAGLSPSEVRGSRTGVFVAVMGSVSSSYTSLDALHHTRKGHDDALSLYAATNATLSVAAGRVSYALGLMGPCSTTDTACSSSLVALHAARRSLQHGECDYAVVCGVNVIDPEDSVTYAVAGMTSADGKCHTFDEAANGYCRGEGCGAIVLKRLSDAITDGDSIYAVVKGSAVLQDGKSASLTAPNGHAQEMLMRAALSDAGVAAEDVQYIEAHGTGTKLGDPIEMQAIAAVYCANRAASDPLLVSSVKANVGHLEGGAGLASLLAAVCVLKNHQAPPNAQLNTLNSIIAQGLGDAAVVLPRKVTDIGSRKSLTVGVSSFGYSGTIAHAILQEAPVGHLSGVNTTKVANASSRRYKSRSNCHRMLQEVQRDKLTGALLAVTRLHAGIMRDWLCDHRVLGDIVVPGAALLELVCAAATFDSTSNSKVSTIYCEGLAISAPVKVVEGGRVYRLVTVVQTSGSVEVFGEGGGVEHKVSHCSGRVECLVGDKAVQAGPDWRRVSSDWSAAAEICTQICDVSAFYSNMRTRGLQYGPSFRLIVSARRSAAECVCVLTLGDKQTQSLHIVPPALIDAMIHSSGLLASGESGGVQVPYAFDQVWIRREAAQAMWLHDTASIHVRLRSSDTDMTVFDCTLVTASGEVVMHMRGVYVRALRTGAAESAPVQQLVSDWQASSVSEVVVNVESQRILLLSHCLDDVGELQPSCERMAFVGSDFSFGSTTHAIYDQIVVVLNVNGLESLGCADLDIEVPEHLEALLPGLLRLIGEASKLADRVIFVNARRSADKDSYNFMCALVSGALVSAQLEYPQVKLVHCTVELRESETIDATVANAISAELVTADHELEVLYREGQRLVKRYSHAPSHQQSGGLMEIRLAGRGSLDNLVLRDMPAALDLLADGFVEVRVSAVSLNFRDVLNVMGMYPGDPGDPGCEFSGVVTRVGGGVESVAVDDEVLGIGSGCLREVVVAHQLMVCRKPRSLSMEQSATVPVVYCTVQHSLGELARLTAGETVLIHSAAGGVGLAAVQFAQSVGARIVATASESKHEYLRSLGVQHILSSRDSELFNAQLQQLLGVDGRVDVVLNSLSGDFIPHSLDALALNGRFVEIGKRGVWTAEQVAARRCDVQYFSVALDVMCAEEPLQFQSLLSGVCNRFENGGWSAQPQRVFDFRTQFADAFRFLRDGNSIGKVVLATSAATKNANKHISGQSFVITGGLGGLGLLTAKLLARSGAKHIFLVSRSGHVAHEGQGLEADLLWLQIESGAAVHVLTCDVSEEAAVVRMLAQVREVAGSLDGVVHCAGVLRDALIRGGGAAAGCVDVWQAKATSAWWLHKHTLQDELKAFVCYSSITAAVGNVGQCAYGAANRFLDSLVSERRRLGLSGVSIRWPAVSGVGMAAATSNKVQDHLSEWSISVSDVEAVLQRLLFSSEEVSAEVLVVAKGFASALAPPISLQFEAFISQSAQPVSTVKRVAKAVVPNKFSAEQIEAATRLLVRDLVTDASQLSDDVSLLEGGLDSFGATELAHLLSREFGLKLFPTFVFDFPTLSQVVAQLCVLLGVSDAQSEALVAPPVLRDVQSDVAIVGVSCRLPGDVNDLSAMWAMLSEGKDMTSEVSLTRWDTDALMAALDNSQESAVVDRIRFGGFLSDTALESFNASAFGISDFEAAQMDPAQRLVLDSCHEALLDAGLSLSEVRGSRTGVFVAAVGVLAGAHSVLQDVHDTRRGPKSNLSVYAATNSTLSVTAGRVSYALGLMGPCSTTDTACSSSLVALHAARRSLQHGECDYAVVCGVNVIDPEDSVTYAVAGMTSADGKCHTFDEAANGYCRGEGCGAIVLKRLSDAMADGDSIYAVVKGSAVLQDGKSASLTAPNGHAQEILMRAALSDAGVAAEDVQYIEAHGTGTKLGDPIEMQAIAAVYCANRAASDPLLVSSVKANVGHLEGGAGLASLLAAVCVLKNHQAPPNAQLNTLNSIIAQGLGDAAVVLPRKVTDIGSRKSLTVGVSSFGYSGTIAHAILQEAPVGYLPKRPKLMPLKVVWQFAGQGTIKVGCGRDLFVQESVFRSALASCDDVLRATVGVTATDLLYPEVSGRYSEAEAERLLLDTRYAQPVLVAFEFALAQLWRSKGAAPDIVLGHSLGEYAAAVVVEVLTIEDCLRLVSARAQLVHDSQACLGVMVATRASVAQVQQAIESTGVSDVSVAAVNGAQNVVVSGSEAGVAAVVAGLGSEVRSLRLGVLHAFHSPLMNSIVQSFAQVLSTVQFHPATCRVVSTVLGRKIAEGEMQDPSYWLRHLRDPVRYSEAVTAAQRSGAAVFVEMGGDQTLSRLAQTILAADDTKVSFFSAISSTPNSFQQLQVPSKRRYKSRSNCHRMLQEVQRDKLTGALVAVTRLHAGILRDWLRDHRVLGDIVVPGAALLELACAAATFNSSRWSSVYCEGLAISAPVKVVEGGRVRSLVTVVQTSGAVEVFGEAGGVGNKMSHCTGRVECLVGDKAEQAGPDWRRVSSDWSAAVESCTQICDVSVFYSTMRARGLQYGPSFRLIASARRSAAECVCVLTLGDKPMQSLHIVPPALIDAMIHSSGLLASGESGVQVPYAFDQVWIRQEAAQAMWLHDTAFSHVTLRSTDADMSVFDCTLLTASGEVAIHMRGVYVRALRTGAAESAPVQLVSEWQASSVFEVAANVESQRILLVCNCLDDVGELQPSCERVSFVGSDLSIGSTTHARYDQIVVVLNASGLKSIGCAGSDVELTEHLEALLPGLLRLIGETSKLADRVIFVNARRSADKDTYNFMCALVSGALVSAQLEYPQVKLVHCTVELRESETIGATLANVISTELATADHELEVLYRDGQRFVKRYSHAPRRQQSEGLTEIHLTERGSLDNLVLRDMPAALDLLADGFVEVRVSAVSLNFRDVLNVMGMYPGDPGDPGCEFSGVVTRVGGGVESVAVGDEVLGIGSGCLREEVVAHHLMVCRKSCSLSMEQSATVPVVYCTVQHSLGELSRLTAGETVLIHSAAGGVGLAAVQFAQSVGARIIATASESKEEYLRSLGVQHILSSRDSQLFNAQLQKLLGVDGRVDVVLNSLSGDFIPYSLDALALNGRFVEIGKRGVWTAEQVAAWRCDVQYFTVALDAMCAEEPVRFQSLLTGVCKGFENGAWSAQPQRVFDFRTQFAEAFRILRDGNSIGKVVLTISAATKNANKLMSGQSFVISGGLGGLGLLTAKLLVRFGAKHIFLVSRSGRVAHEGQGLEADLLWLQTESGAAVHVLTCDMSEEAAVVRMLAQVREVAGSLDGVVHCAGVLRDALIRGGGAAAGCVDVWQAKAASAWWLHKHTLQDELKAFVCYSSITAAVGNVGQCAYGAANRFLDSLVSERKRLGLSGVSIRWPAVAGVGMAAAHELLSSTSMKPDEVTRVLAHILAEEVTNASEIITLVPVTMVSIVSPSLLSTQFECIADVQGVIPLRNNKVNEIVVEQPVVSVAHVEAVVREHVSKLLRDASALTSHDVLMDVGFDSLSGTELATSLSKALSIRVMPSLVFTHPTMAEMVDFCAQALGLSTNSIPVASDQPEPLVDTDKAEEVTEAPAGLGIADIGGFVQKVRDVLCSLSPQCSERAHDDSSTLSSLGFDTAEQLLELAAALSAALSVEVKAEALSGGMMVGAVLNLIVELKGVLEQMFAAGSSTLAGDTFGDNPWFSNFFSDLPQARARLIVFGGIAQPTISWFQIAKVFNAHGVHVHVVRLPGRYDRPYEEPLLDATDNIKGVCQALKDLNFLTDLPLSVLGHSGGAVMAYECARYLEHCCGITPGHFISLAGPSRESFKRWVFIDPADRRIESLRPNMEQNFGRVNPQFDANIQYLPLLMTIFFEVYHRDMNVAVSCFQQYDALCEQDRHLHCGVLCINGDRDICLENKCWQDLAKGTFQQIVYPGDHYIILQDSNADKAIAADCCRVMLRSLGIFV